MSEQTTQQNDVDAIETDEVVEQRMPNLTPYYAAKVVEAVFSARGIEGTRPTPQMMYSYAKKGTIKTVEGTKKVMFDGNAFKKWLDEYIQKAASGLGAGKVDIEVLADQFM
jgi:hypothetical protein